MQLDEMVRKIGAADSEMIDMILDAAINRKRELYPEWEMVYLALPKNDPQERKRTLEWVWKDLAEGRKL